MQNKLMIAKQQKLTTAVIAYRSLRDEQPISDRRLPLGDSPSRASGRVHVSLGASQRGEEY